MFRKVNDTFEQWLATPKRKALLVTGARQVGKTYSIRKFARAHYQVVVELNFLTTPQAAAIFSGALDAATLITGLTAFTRKALKPGRTLIFLDEIQECPRAHTALKFLVEDGRFDYIASGSLLGVHYRHDSSYPVGYEEEVKMYPLDFEEFCLAAGVQQDTLDYLRGCYEQGQIVLESIHQVMLDLFLRYIVVGGMPAVVKRYVDTKDIAQVIKLQQDILRQYRQDIVKYAAVGKAAIAAILDHLPGQLEGKNRRFMLSSLSANARLRDFANYFLWLSDAGVALPCYSLKEPKIPLKINEQTRLFKLYLNDVGLLCALSMEDVQFAILKGDLAVNLGGIMENAFASLLKSQGFELRYLQKQHIGELDFVINRGLEVLALEVKSGMDYHRHSALDHALQVAEWQLKGVVFCRGNYERLGEITYLPWYMVMFMYPENSHPQLDNLDLSALKPPQDMPAGD
ncbi:MAG: ATP-binding protein [Succinivibrio sp.]|nr:ATP-binding protein [Succinivibrio sp.]